MAARDGLGHLDLAGPVLAAAGEGGDDAGRDWRAVDGRRRAMRLAAVTRHRRRRVPSRAPTAHG